MKYINPILFLLYFCYLSAFSANQVNDRVVSKHRSSYYTETKVHNAAENIRKYAWAKKEKDNAVKHADEWLADYHNDYGLIWAMMPSQRIPRSFAVNSLDGCLVCGTAINKYGNYSYLYNKNKVDWKLTCPNCHLTFPTNDFKAYYTGGIDKSGNFDPDKAQKYNEYLIQKGKRGNLVNLYAINGLTSKQLKDLKAAGASDSTIHEITTNIHWGVDNGIGYHFNPADKKKYGNPYTYVAYYSHWVLWYWQVMPMLEDLSKAYMYTRFSENLDERNKSQIYADAAIVMLDRISDLYPEMYVARFPRHGYFGFPNCGYVWGTDLSAGRVIGSVWENTLIKNVMFAYDAVFPAIKSLSFKAKDVLAHKSGQPNKGNPDCIKVNFENGVLREVAKAFAEGNLQGNPGMQQSTLALAAVVIDHNPETQQWLNIVFKNGISDWHSIGKRDGGSIMRYIVDKISRDGQGDEVSLGYNSGWLENWIVVAKVLDGYHIPDGKTLDGNININLYSNSRFEKLFYVNPILLTDNYAPHIGDTGATGQADHSTTDINNIILGYSKYRTTRLAQKVYLLKNKKIEDIHMNIFTKNPEDIKLEIRDEIKKHGEFYQSSENQSAYGLAIMRDGLAPKTNKEKKTQRSLWMFYGTRNASHNHADPLNIGYIAYDLDLMPDFGYPNTLGGDLNPEQQWDKSTPAHNTVSFDALGYRGHVVGYGKPLHYDVTKEIQLIHASSNEVENSYKLFAKDYERATALIRINDEDSYIVDFFRVNSKYPYTYNFHTAEVDNTATNYCNITFDPSAAITYDKNTLRNVKTAYTHGGQFSTDWNVVDTWNQYSKGIRAKTNVHLKITMLGCNKKIKLGEAVPPTNNSANPVWVPILQVPGVGETTYASVIEPYNRNSKIVSIEALPVKEGKEVADSNIVKALRIKLINGRTDYIVISFNKNATYQIAKKINFCGFFCLYSVDKDGKVIHKYINDCTLFGGKKFQGRITGKVIDATKILSDNNYITIKTHQKINLALLKGKYIYVDNCDIPDSKEDDALVKYNAVYPILSATKQSNNIYRLNLGTCSVVRGFSDLSDYNKGYLRDFNLGSAFYIPLSYTNYSH